MPQVNNNKKPVAYHNSFKKLQQKAQELLSLENINSSDTSSISDLNGIAQEIQNSAKGDSLQKVSSSIKTDSPKAQKNEIFKSSNNNEIINKEHKNRKKVTTKKTKQINQHPKTKSIKQKSQIKTERYLRFSFLPIRLYLIEKNILTFKNYVK